MKKLMRLKFLERQVKSAVLSFTKTINQLEVTNKEYVKIQVEIIDEVKKLNTASSSIDLKIEQNNRMLNNFKQLLK